MKLSIKTLTKIKRELKSLNSNKTGEETWLIFTQTVLIKHISKSTLKHDLNTTNCADKAYF